MAARGTEAKNNVAVKLKDLYGPDFVGVFDKKIIINEHENGEIIQLAITLTCPKNTYGLDLENEGSNEVSNFEPAEITPNEIDNIKKLMEQLGL